MGGLPHIIPFGSKSNHVSDFFNASNPSKETRSLLNAIMNPPDMLSDFAVSFFFEGAFLFEGF